MKSYSEMSKQELQSAFELCRARYEEFCLRDVTLNMARGNPSLAQMNLSREMFNMVTADGDFTNETGIDCRNYGGLDGLPELKRIFADMMDVEASQVIVGGNSSLNMMFDTIAQFMTHGSYDGATPWAAQKDIKFICLVPGYDRHFKICEHFGIKMINVPLKENGPDMEFVRKYVADPTVKGMWCVPKYSNPSGVVYSDEIIDEIAKLKPAANDFRIMWDNAYCVHHLTENEHVIPNLIEECEKYGNEDMVIKFASTSKITFPGAGVAAVAASARNVAFLKKRMSFQTIGPDKLNQLRHARMFKSIEDIKAHMRKHAAIVAPKFKAVLMRLEKELGGLDIATWTNPEGGYFISLNVMEGCAKRVVELCREAGVVLTPAGATYPYGVDEKDSNIRIAPTYPSSAELDDASELLCIAVKYAVLEKMLG